MNTSIAYLNGQFLPLEEVKISPLDRGFLFADGAYEVIPVYNSCPFRLAEHIKRLENSLAGLKFAPLNYDWLELLQTLVERNKHHNKGNLSLYLQVTRGAPEVRDHNVPEQQSVTVFAMAKPLPATPVFDQVPRYKTVTVPQVRYGDSYGSFIRLIKQR